MNIIDSILKSNFTLIQYDNNSLIGLKKLIKLLPDRLEFNFFDTSDYTTIKDYLTNESQKVVIIELSNIMVHASVFFTELYNLKSTSNKIIILLRNEPRISMINISDLYMLINDLELRVMKDRYQNQFSTNLSDLFNFIRNSKLEKLGI